MDEVTAVSAHVFTMTESEESCIGYRGVMWSHQLSCFYLYHFLK